MATPDDTVTLERLLKELADMNTTLQALATQSELVAIQLHRLQERVEWLSRRSR